MNTEEATQNETTAVAPDLSGATDSDINSIFDQLTAADYTMAKINEDLKDAERRQEIGKRLVAMLHEAAGQGLSFQKIKLSTKAGVLKVGMEVPIVLLRDLLGLANPGSA